MPQTPSQMRTRSNSNPTSAVTVTLSDVKNLMETVLTEKLGSLEKKIDSVVDSLKMVITRMEKIEGKHKEIESRCRRIEEDQMNIFSELEERERRKTNLVVTGVPEREDGTVKERMEWDEEKVKSLFQDLAELDRGDFTKTYRLGRVDSRKPRPLKIVCRSDEIKRKILMKAKDLRSMSTYEGTYVNPDQTPLQQRQSKALREEYKRRKTLGENVLLRHGKIISRQNFQ